MTGRKAGKGNEMLIKHSSFARALGVLALLESCEPIAFSSERIYSEAYQNGREQGVTIYGFDNMSAYFIAEHRNSDQIVVYHGEYSMQALSDSAYRNPHFFGTIEDAAEWLVKHIADDLLAQKTKRAAKTQAA